MINFVPEIGEEIITFTAYEEEKNLGNCTFRLDGYKMYFLTVDCGDDIIAEGLARAAMNYAANRNAYIAKISKSISSLIPGASDNSEGFFQKSTYSAMFFVFVKRRPFLYKVPVAPEPHPI